MDRAGGRTHSAADRQAKVLAELAGLAMEAGDLDQAVTTGLHLNLP